MSISTPLPQYAEHSTVCPIQSCPVHCGCEMTGAPLTVAPRLVQARSALAGSAQTARNPFAAGTVLASARDSEKGGECVKLGSSSFVLVGLGLVGLGRCGPSSSNDPRFEGGWGGFGGSYRRGYGSVGLGHAKKANWRNFHGKPFSDQLKAIRSPFFPVVPNLRYTVDRM